MNALVLLAASLLSADREITLDEAAKAPFIAMGLVTRLEHVGDRPLATLDVEYVGRGQLGSQIQFFADPQADCCQPSASIGAREVVFLERASKDPIRFQLVGQGAGEIRVGRVGNALVAAGSKYGGVHFPDAICDRSLSQRSEDCGCTLSSLLRYLKLAEPPPFRDSKTFRVATRTCPACTLDDWIQRLSSPKQTDCALQPDKAQQTQCALRASSKKEPFRLTRQLNSIDSTVSEAFVSDGTKVFRLSYDSSVEGGGSCAARVGRETCASIKANKGQLLECVQPYERTALCEQINTRIEALGPPMPLDRLSCDQQRVTCQIGDGGTLPDDVHETICSDLGRMFLYCR